jgi:hypothetical protein
MVRCKIQAVMKRHLGRLVDTTEGPHIADGITAPPKIVSVAVCSKERGLLDQLVGAGDKSSTECPA